MKSRARNRKIQSGYENLILVVSLCVLCICYFLIINTKAKEQEYGYNLNYTHIKLNYGDSLDSLAEQYNNTKLSNEDYKVMIMDINRLSKDKLNPGCYLTVAYEVR